MLTLSTKIIQTFKLGNVEKIKYFRRMQKSNASEWK